MCNAPFLGRLPAVARGRAADNEGKRLGRIQECSLLKKETWEAYGNPNFDLFVALALGYAGVPPSLLFFLGLQGPGMQWICSQQLVHC
jgi:hypothetical protein